MIDAIVKEEDAYGEATKDRISLMRWISENFLSSDGRAGNDTTSGVAIPQAAATRLHYLIEVGPRGLKLFAMH